MAPEWKNNSWKWYTPYIHDYEGATSEQYIRDQCVAISADLSSSVGSRKLELYELHSVRLQNELTIAIQSDLSVEEVASIVKNGKNHLRYANEASHRIFEAEIQKKKEWLKAQDDKLTADNAKLDEAIKVRIANQGNPSATYGAIAPDGSIALGRVSSGSATLSSATSGLAESDLAVSNFVVSGSTDNPDLIPEGIQYNKGNRYNEEIEGHVVERGVGSANNYGYPVGIPNSQIVEAYLPDLEEWRNENNYEALEAACMKYSIATVPAIMQFNLNAKYMFRLIDSMTSITTSDLLLDTKQRLVGVAIEHIDKVREDSNKLAADIHESINEVATDRDGLAQRMTQGAMRDVGIMRKVVKIADFDSEAPSSGFASVTDNRAINISEHDNEREPSKTAERELVTEDNDTESNCSTIFNYNAWRPDRTLPAPTSESNSASTVPEEDEASDEDIEPESNKDDEDFEEEEDDDSDESESAGPRKKSYYTYVRKSTQRKGLGKRKPEDSESDYEDTNVGAKRKRNVQQG